MKKITSMFLALVMALALAVPAFADETLKIDGTIQMPTINVVMPTTASLVLNPYEMDVELVRGQPKVDDQIISSAMQIKNLSNIAIQVGAKAVGTIGKGDVEFAAASVASDTAAKKAYIYGVFEVGKITDTVDSNATANVTLSTNEAEVTDFEFADGTAATSTNTLAPVLLDDTKNPAPNGVLNFQFFGDMSKRTDWTDKDTLGITLTFKFTPDATYTPTAGDASVSVTINGTTATAAVDLGTSGLTVASYAWTSGTVATATVAGDTATATITEADGASASDTSVITVTVTLNNGATITGTATYTVS